MRDASSSYGPDPSHSICTRIFALRAQIDHQLAAYAINRRMAKGPHSFASPTPSNGVGFYLGATTMRKPATVMGLRTNAGS